MRQCPNLSILRTNFQPVGHGLLCFYMSVYSYKVFSYPSDIFSVFLLYVSRQPSTFLSFSSSFLVPYFFSLFLVQPSLSLHICPHLFLQFWFSANFVFLFSADALSFSVSLMDFLSCLWFFCCSPCGFTCLFPPTYSVKQYIAQEDVSQDIRRFIVLHN